jgi:flagellin
MAFSIGGNYGMLRSLNNLRSTQSKMDQALERISSGLKINSAADDAGGLALGMKLSNEVNITSAERQGVDNAKSFVDSQSANLQTAADIVGEMKTLKTSYDAAALAGTDTTAYEAEFQELRSQLGQLTGQSFNGNPLFTTTIDPSDDPVVAGVSLDDIDLESALETDASGARGAAIKLADPNDPTPVSLADAEIYDELNDIENSVLRELGKSAANSSALGYASSYLETKEANLEAARSRVMDADIVEESTNLSKYTMQYEAAVAAIAQANSTQQTVMELLLFPGKK